MKRVTALLGLLVVIIPLASCNWNGAMGGNGRYQMVLLPGLYLEYEKVLIIDTKEGHLWTWNQIMSESSAGISRRIEYQGKVSPGARMGDIIANEFVKLKEQPPQPEPPAPPAEEMAPPAPPEERSYR